MKPCEYYEEMMSRLLDGELSGEEEAALWDHIAQCPRCAQTYEGYVQMTAALRNELEEPPAELSRLVMARIEGQSMAAPKHVAAHPGSVHRLRPWRKLAVAACFVVVVAAGAITGVFGRGASLVRSNTAADTASGAVSADYQMTQQQETARTAEADQSAAAAPAAGPAQIVPEQPEAASEDSVPEVPEAVVEESAPEVPEAVAEEGAAENDASAARSSLPVPADAETEQTAPEAAPVPEDAPDASALAKASADSGIMTIMEPLPTAADAASGLVCDSAGQEIGRIEDADGLAALLTGERWQGEEPETVYTVTMDGKDYAFAQDEGGALLWQRTGDEGFTLSPASLADLEGLIVK